MEEKWWFFVGVFLLFTLLASNSVLSLGVAYDYLEDDTLLVGLGQSVNYKLYLQNSDTEEVAIKIILNSDIAKVKGESSIVVPANSYDTVVLLEISIPVDAKVGEVKKIDYSIEPSTNNEGMVPLTLQMNQHFFVKIIGNDGSSESIPTENKFIDLGSIKNKFLSQPFEKFNNFFVKAKLLVLGFMKFIIISVIVVLISLILFYIWRRSTILVDKIRINMSGMKKKEKIINSIVVGNWFAWLNTFKINSLVSTISKSNSIKNPINTKAKYNLILINKVKIVDLASLYDAIYVMDKVTFQYHVHKFRNDFSWWLEDSLMMEGLAKKLYKYSTKDHFIRILGDELDKIDRQNK